MAVHPVSPLIGFGSKDSHLLHHISHPVVRGMWILLILMILVPGCEPPPTRPAAKPESKIHILVTELIKPQMAAINAAPGDAELHGTLGLMYEANEIWEPAIRSFQNACDIEPGNSLWQVHLHRSRLAHGSSTGERERLETLLPRFPGDAAFNYALGSLRLEDGDLSGAGELLNRSLQLQPGEPATHLALSRLELLNANAEQALFHAEQAMIKAPGQPAVHQARGLALQALGRSEQALPDLEKGQGAFPLQFPDAGMRRLSGYFATPQKQINLASDLIQVGQYPRAIQLMLRVLSLESTNKDALNTIAIALQKMKRYEEALEKLLLARKSDPDYFPTYINLAVLYLEMNRPQQAIDPARKAVRIAPENSVSHRLLGMGLVRTQKYSEALTSFEESLRLQPGNFECHAAASEAAMSLRLNERAKGHLDQAIALRPEYLPTQVNMAYLLMRMNRPDESEALIKRLLKDSKEHPRVVDAYQKLRKNFKSGSRQP